MPDIGIHRDPIKILLVDDQPDVGALVRVMLAQSGLRGFALAEAHSLAGALARLRQESFDAVLLDLTLPDSTGLPTLQEIASAAPSLAIIVLTANEDQAVVAEAVKAGAQDYLVKGQFNGRGLARALRHAVERHRIQQALRASEERYRLLFERNLAGVYRATREGHIIDCNHAFAAIFGFASPEAIKTHTTPEFFLNIADREALLQQLDREGRVANAERRLRRRNGKPIWVLESMVLLQEEAGQEVIEGTLIDITERKRLEEALAREQYLLRSMMDHFPDAIFFKDAQSRFLRASRHCAQRLGLDNPIALIGKSDFDFYDRVHAQAAFEDEQRIMRTGEPILSQEEDETWPDGHHTYCLTTKLPLRDVHGRIMGTFGVSRDVTELKESQFQIEALRRRLELILNSAGEGICGLDGDGAISFANPTAAHLLGYTVEQLQGRSFHDLVHSNLASGIRCGGEECALRASCREGTANKVREDLFSRSDLSIFPVDVISTPIQDDRGEPGAVMTFRDIRERKQMERLKDEFVSVVSHELRTPLTAIRGALGLLASGRMGPMPETGRKMLDIASANTDRLVRLINDILDVERINSGKVKMECAACDIGELIRASVDLMNPMAEKAGVTLHAEPIGAPIWADSDRMTQMLTNLISNAIKFSPPGGEVLVSAVRLGSALRIAVRDQGRGIPEDQLEKIFERFHQVDKTDSRDRGGTGLGLPICRSIVQQHRGRIWAESRPGQGSVFYVIMALHEPGLRAPAEEAETAARQAAAEGGTPTPDGAPALD